MNSKQVEKDFKIVLYLLSTVMCIIIDFNLIGALIIKDLNWIMDNWIKNSWFILVPYFIILHYVIIFKYKWMKI